MALQFKLQLVVVTDDDEQVSVDELVVLNKDYERLAQLGLTLAEAKALLELQRQVLTRQIAAFLASRISCPTCGRSRGIKDRKTTLFRTLFGKLELASPRLRRCPCQPSGQASTSPLVEVLSEHTAPELLYLESKWSSLLSYGLTRRSPARSPMVQLPALRGRIRLSSDGGGAPFRARAGANEQGH